MTFFELNEEKNVEYWCLDLGVVIFWLSEPMSTVMQTKDIGATAKLIKITFSYFMNYYKLLD